MPFNVYLGQPQLPDADLPYKDRKSHQKLMQACLHREENGTKGHFGGCFLCYGAGRLAAR